MTEPTNEKKRASYLAVNEQFNLQHQCRMLSAAFGFCTYQVGSSLERANYRDVDLRCILDDAEFDAMFCVNENRLKFLNVCISEWLSARTSLPIDFQFQRQTDANKEFDGHRNFVGVPFRAAALAAVAGGKEKE